MGLVQAIFALESTPSILEDPLEMVYLQHNDANF